MALRSQWSWLGSTPIAPAGDDGAVAADGLARDRFAHSAAIAIPANGALFLRADDS